jgi:hypothetical protein
MQKKLSQKAAKEQEHQFKDLYGLLCNETWLRVAVHKTLSNTCIPHFSERIACERIPALIFTMRCRHEHDTPRHRI